MYGSDKSARSISLHLHIFLCIFWLQYFDGKISGVPGPRNELDGIPPLFMYSKITEYDKFVLIFVCIL